MPTYVYKCSNEKCGKETEKFVSLKDFDTSKTTECQECAAEARRIISARQVTHTSWSSWQN